MIPYQGAPNAQRGRFSVKLEGTPGVGSLTPRAKTGDPRVGLPTADRTSSKAPTIVAGAAVGRRGQAGGAYPANIGVPHADRSRAAGAAIVDGAAFSRQQARPPARIAHADDCAGRASGRVPKARDPSRVAAPREHAATVHASHLVLLDLVRPADIDRADGRAAVDRPAFRLRPTRAAVARERAVLRRLAFGGPAPGARRAAARPRSARRAAARTRSARRARRAAARRARSPLSRAARPRRPLPSEARRRGAGCPPGARRSGHANRSGASRRAAAASGRRGVRARAAGGAVGAALFRAAGGQRQHEQAEHQRGSLHAISYSPTRRHGLCTAAGRPVTAASSKNSPTRCEDTSIPGVYGMAEMRCCHGHRGSILAFAGLFVILGAIGCSGTTGPEPEPFVSGVPPAAAAHFKKGINLGNRLDAPNEGDWEGVIQAEDFPFIAQRGFDHVRIPIRFSGHALAASPHTIDAAFLSQGRHGLGPSGRRESRRRGGHAPL